ncbi:hypothetical protein NDU88_003527 [Pleurodeles waltl]|uniref:Reverse transcriptase domain-containing protein n=1 Tax=Pleurodeles waltl TaxID=8319 RepID=A0AAV7T6X4_PLEWA|nr:hypothetical protein NDU88_003527 [Pleurodeles waltl]
MLPVLRRPAKDQPFLDEISYADDTQLIILVGPDVDRAIHRFQECIRKFATWIKTNCLQRNGENLDLTVRISPVPLDPWLVACGAGGSSITMSYCEKSGCSTRTEMFHEECHCGNMRVLFCD